MTAQTPDDGPNAEDDELAARAMAATRDPLLHVVSVALDGAAFVVRAFRGRRNFHLGRGDYSKVVREEPGQPPAKDRAEALRRELAEKSHRSRLGWTHITITPHTEEPTP